MNSIFSSSSRSIRYTYIDNNSTHHFIISGNALSCIECNSVNDKECGDPFTANQEKYLVSCEPNEKYCGKTVSTENTRMREYFILHFFLCIHIEWIWFKQLTSMEILAAELWFFGGDPPPFPESCSFAIMVFNMDVLVSLSSSHR